MSSDVAHRASLNIQQGTPQIVAVDKTNATKTIKAIGEAKNNAAISGMAFVYPGKAIGARKPLLLSASNFCFSEGWKNINV